MVIPTYWDTVLSLPKEDAGTTTPMDRATPRRPVTASSRPMITMATHARTMSTCTRATRAAATRSLSATGSSRVPKRVTWLRRRAMKPSSQSVSEAATKMPAAISTLTRSEEMTKTMMSGTRTIRNSVSAIGRLKGKLIGSHPGPDFDPSEYRPPRRPKSRNRSPA